MPLKFFDGRSQIGPRRSADNRLAVIVMIFLPRTDLGAQEACRTRSVESAVFEARYTIYGWRQVPVDVSVISRKAQETRPEIEADVIAGPLPRPAIFGRESSKRNLYLVRRRIEKRVVPSADRRLLHLLAVVPIDHLQGLFLPAENLSVFLSRPQGIRARKPRHAILFHQRYSTNTFPQWWLKAQPVPLIKPRAVAEINAIRGNEELDAQPRDQDWRRPRSASIRRTSSRLSRRARRTRRRSLRVPGDLPLRPRRADRQVDAGQCRRRRATRRQMPKAHLDMFKYLGSVMEPWDSPRRAGDDRQPGRSRGWTAMRCAPYATRIPRTGC
nr:hypothetical protein [Sphingomonas panacisoli]